jgi:DnaJ-class molecular chaperone
MVYKLGITLKQFYNGVTKKLKINRRKTCDTCEGSGLSLGKEADPCYVCQGKGIKVETSRVGRGVVQQRHITCDKCSGHGKTIADENKCLTCSGNKTVFDPNIIEVNIIPGMREGMALRFENQGDELPNTIPGDLIVVLLDKEDTESPYERYNENDLFYNHKISLLDSLRGWNLKLKLLDDSVITVRSPSGKYTPHGTLLKISSKGMPIINTSKNGDLIINIIVEYPEPGVIGPEQIEELSKILPSTSEEYNDDDDDIIDATIIS